MQRRFTMIRICLAYKGSYHPPMSNIVRLKVIPTSSRTSGLYRVYTSKMQICLCDLDVYGRGVGVGTPKLIFLAFADVRSMPPPQYLNLHPPHSFDQNLWWVTPKWKLLFLLYCRRHASFNTADLGWLYKTTSYKLTVQLHDKLFSSSGFWSFCN